MKIIILGMHRSGTSLASGLLSLCGVHFGEESEFIRPNDENPKGFWERQDVRKLNDELLHHIGCDWSEISNLYKNEPPEKAITNFNSEASRIVNKLEQESSSGVIGLKEPRLCLLMPFWQHFLDKDDFILIVYRDPEEIAISLKNRNGIPFQVSNYLTERYLELALHAAKNRHHFIVSFKDLIENPARAIANIVSALAALGQKLSIPSKEILAQYSSPQLYRSRSTGSGFRTTERLQYFYDCMNHGELPNIELIEIPVPVEVLTYQHSKRFEEFKKVKWRLDHLEKQLETSNEQLLVNRQLLLLVKNHQIVHEGKIQRQNMELSDAIEQVKSDQLLLRISDNTHEQLQLLFGSYTWRISRRLMTLMLRPFRLGFGPTILDQIDQSLETYKQRRSQSKSGRGLTASEGCQEPEALITYRPDSDNDEKDLSSKNHENISTEPALHFIGKKGPLVKVGLVVTEDSNTTSAGDFYTAKELATALSDSFGWECLYLPEHSKSCDWYDVSDLDILVVLLDKYDISRIHGQNRPVFKIAWLRNWIDRWTSRPWFQSYDLVLCTSEIARTFVYEETGKFAQILKIATNTMRFHPLGEPDLEMQSDYCFTGNYWGAPRQIENFDPSDLPYQFALFGTGWENHKQFVSCNRGRVPYENLPMAYANTRILIDDANHVTKPWASVNSRVFDALATGTLVITNGIAGAKETFGDLLPTYSTNQELKQQLRLFLEQPDKLSNLTKKLQHIVERDHTYKNRAHQLHNILNQEINAKARIAIKLPVLNANTAIFCNEFVFGKSLAKALRKLGYLVRLDFESEWYSKPAIPDDVVITIRGHSRYIPEKSYLNLLWMISHPDDVPVEECEEYDHVFVASTGYAKVLSKQTKTNVMPLLQCTDPEIFQIQKVENKRSTIVYIGNSKQAASTILDDILESGLKPTVVGTGWQGLIDENLIAGEFIEKSSIPEFYTINGIVLCDHQSDMAEHGFLSNQLFDAVACGATPICADIPGIEEIFGNLVYVYSGGPDQLRFQVQKALAENLSMKQERLELAQEFAKHHSFEVRTRLIDSIVSHDLQLKKVLST